MAGVNLTPATRRCPLIVARPGHPDQLTQGDSVTQGEADELYKVVGSDPQRWVEKSQGLLYCARVLIDQLASIWQFPSHSRTLETLGLFDSILLLLGFALENLIKGVYISNNPGIVNDGKLDRSEWKYEGGHGILKYAGKLLKLEPDEVDLLVRLQEYIVWAGRYPIPTKSSRYHESKSAGRNVLYPKEDFEVAERLFNKLLDKRSLPNP